MEGLRALSARMAKTPNQESRLPLILDPDCEYKSYAWCHPRSLHHLGKRALGYADYVGDGQCGVGYVDYVGYAGYVGQVGCARYAPWVWSERRLARYYLPIC